MTCCAQFLKIIFIHLASSNTESFTYLFVGDFTEILENTFLLGWSESKKSIRCLVEQVEDESSQRWSGSVGDVSS